MLELHYDLDTLPAAIRSFREFTSGYRVIVFSGSLGAGKTTFIAALARAYGVTDPVSSPTFSIINSYGCPEGPEGYTQIFHMDWYRLRDEEEAIHSGIEDSLLDERARVWVEWPEKASGIIPPGTLAVHIEATGETSRQLRTSLLAA